jgi:hypothetical protein
MKNGVFWDVTVRTEVSEERSVSTIRLTRIGELGTTDGLLVTASFVPSSPILVSVLMEALSEASALTRATRRNIPKTPFFLLKYAR